MTIYSAELRTTLNQKTFKKRWYVKICGVWRRISEQDFIERLEPVFRTDSFLTTTRGDLVQQDSTIYF